MKATQYAARITTIQDPDTQKVLTELGKVGKDFYNEFVAIKEQRKLSYDDGFYALLFEFEQKFEKFAILVNKKHPGLVKADGFIQILKQFNTGIIQHLDGPYLEYKKNKKNGKT